jgi:hypothetical protein
VFDGERLRTACAVYIHVCLESVDYDDPAPAQWMGSGCRTAIFAVETLRLEFIRNVLHAPIRKIPWTPLGMLRRRGQFAAFASGGDATCGR